MRILIPILGFGKSGGDRVLAQFANHWIEYGHSVSFLCKDTESPPYFHTDAEIIKYNRHSQICNISNTTQTKSHDYLGENKSRIFNTLIIILRRVKKFIFRFDFLVEQLIMLKALNNITENFNVVLANHSLTAFPVSLSKLKAKKFYYIQAYEPEYYENFGGVLNTIVKLYSRQTYKINNLTKIVNSPIYYSYREIKANKFVFCGLDLDTYFPKPIEKIDMHKKIIKIGTIGRVEKYKGTWYVLEAFKMLKRMNENLCDFELHIAFGDKSFEDLDNGIVVLSPHGDVNLANFYREMDIIIAAGIVQFGAVHYPVLESMACRTPVITTFYLPAHDGNAWLCEPESIESICEQIINIINSDSLTDKTSNALRDIQQFKWEIVSRKMLTYFTKEII